MVPPCARSGPPATKTSCGNFEEFLGGMLNWQRVTCQLSTAIVRHRANRPQGGMELSPLSPPRRLVHLPLLILFVLSFLFLSFATTSLHRVSAFVVHDRRGQIQQINHVNTTTRHATKVNNTPGGVHGPCPLLPSIQPTADSGISAESQQHPISPDRPCPLQEPLPRRLPTPILVPTGKRRAICTLAEAVSFRA